MELIFGCMFAGKTSELIRRVGFFQRTGAKCLVVNHPLDSRYGENSVVSHDGVRLAALCTNDLIMIDLCSWDAIFVDEGQFFNDLVPFSYLCRKKRKILCVAGLNGDYRARVFGEMYKLIPHATKITYLTASCHVCGSPAMYSKRLGEEVVGTNYVPCCVEHAGNLCVGRGED